MPSIKEVARRAGVSISTVSHVIRGSKPVSERLRRRVEQAVRELNYEINPVASSLKSKTTHTLGIIIPNINRIFFPQVIKGIQETCFVKGYNLTFCDTNEQLKLEKHFVQMLKNSMVDGIILDSVADEQDTAYFEFLSQLKNRKKIIPVVSLERQLNGSRVDSIIVDNRLGGELAARHLVECGCENVAHISGPDYSCMARARLQGFQDELAKKGLKTQVFSGDFSPLSGYQAIKTQLQQGTTLDGIFAANDQMAIGALRALKEEGRRVPEEIKVVGFDNTFVASLASPALTTINVPKHKMGQTAADLLLRRLENPGQAPINVELPINLIVRQSTELHGESTWDLYGW